MMDAKEKIDYWLELAEEDLITAEVVLNSKRYLHFGFLSHQTVEKLIKAYYWKNKNEEPPYIHNLLKLSSSSGLNSILSEIQNNLLYKLMPLNIEARYPTIKDEIYRTLSKDYCETIFRETQEFLQWMKVLLAK